MRDCDELHMVFECFGAHLNEVVAAGLQAATRATGAESHQDEVEMLKTELDLEASDALSKLEDTIEALIPVLQARALQHCSLEL
jgi:hypothetical protein